METTPSDANPVVEPSTAGYPVRPTLSEITVTPFPVQVNMNKLVGVIFARLTAIEQRLAALERAAATPAPAPST